MIVARSLIVSGEERPSAPPGLIHRQGLVEADPRPLVPGEDEVVPRIDARIVLHAGGGEEPFGLAGRISGVAVAHLHNVTWPGQGALERDPRVVERGTDGRVQASGPRSALLVHKAQRRRVDRVFHSRGDGDRVIHPSVPYPQAVL